MKARPLPLRTGVIGCGSMGANHARAYSLLPDAELTGVHDPDLDRARAVAERFGCRAFDSIDELLEAVDAVTVASPSHLHVEQALRALAHGCDVLIEKPIALTTHDARQLRQAVARDPRGPVVAAGHVEHFNPAVRELRTLIRGREVVGVDCRRLGPANERNRDIDVVQDLMLHDLHIVLDLLDGAPAAVHGAGVPSPGDGVVDYAVATIVFDDGPIATFGASRATEERVRRMSISTRDMHINVDLAARTLETCRSTNLHEMGTAGVRQQSVVERLFVPNEEPLLLQTLDFVDACHTRRPPAVGLDAGVQCIELVDAVRRRAGQALPTPISVAS